MHQLTSAHVCAPCSHLPSLPLGVLHDVPDLQQRAATKLVEKQQRLLLGLQESLETLSQAVQGLEDAAASVEEVAAKEAAAPVLGQQPVFTALPLPTIASMLRELHAMHASELHVKGVVVDGLAVVCWQAAQEGIAGRHSGSGSGGGRAAVRAQDAVEAKLQVHITAWMLCAEVQAARVTDNLALLTSDCSA